MNFKSVSLKNFLQLLTAVATLVSFSFAIIYGIINIIDYTSYSGIDYSYLTLYIINSLVFSVVLIFASASFLKNKEYDNFFKLYFGFIVLNVLFFLIKRVALADYAIEIFVLMILERFIPENKEEICEKTPVVKTKIVENTEAVSKVQEENLVEKDVENQEEKLTEKKIVKTKIINTFQRESSSSKKRGKLLSALATGLTAGVGGSTADVMRAQHGQDVRNIKNADMETVFTFLVVYNNGTRETVEVVEGSEKYNELILYID